MKSPITESSKNNAVNSFRDQMAAFRRERQAALEGKLPALQRLAIIAQNDSDQAGAVRRFLLGLYNGHRWPFDLTTLRGLDKELFADCVAVLTLDARATVKEVHQYFNNGGELFEKFAKLEN